MLNIVVISCLGQLTAGLETCRWKGGCWRDMNPCTDAGFQWMEAKRGILIPMDQESKSFLFNHSIYWPYEPVGLYVLPPCLTVLTYLCVRSEPARFAQTWSVKVLFCVHTGWWDCKSVPTMSQRATTPAFLTRPTHPSGSTTAWQWWPSTPSEMPRRTPWRSTSWKSVGWQFMVTLFGSTYRSKDALPHV